MNGRSWEVIEGKGAQNGIKQRKKRKTLYASITQTLQAKTVKRQGV